MAEPKRHQLRVSNDSDEREQQQPEAGQRFTSGWRCRVLIVIDDVAFERDRQEVVAVPAGLERDEQSVECEGSHGGERELRW